MLNKTDDGRKTYFIDLDGTVVIHNYDPDHEQDIIIPESLEVLKKISGEYLVMTTSRKEEHLEKILDTLLSEGIVFDEIIHSLPTGKRIIINDYKNGNPFKAWAINVERDKGIPLSSL